METKFVFAIANTKKKITWELYRLQIPIAKIKLYLPLSIFTIDTFIRSGQLTWQVAWLTGLLGVLYQIVPMFAIGVLALVQKPKVHLV